MNKEEIIFDWLHVKENRDRLTTREVDANTFEAFEHYGCVYHFGKYGEEAIYTLGNKFYKLIKKENDTVPAIAK